MIRVPFTYRRRDHWVSIDPAIATTRPHWRVPILTHSGRIHRYVTIRFSLTPHLTATVIEPKEPTHAAL